MSCRSPASPSESPPRSRPPSRPWLLLGRPGHGAGHAVGLGDARGQRGTTQQPHVCIHTGSLPAAEGFISNHISPSCIIHTYATQNTCGAAFWVGDMLSNVNSGAGTARAAGGTWTGMQAGLPWHRHRRRRFARPPSTSPGSRTGNNKEGIRSRTRSNEQKHFCSFTHSPSLAPAPFVHGTSPRRLLRLRKVRVPGRAAPEARAIHNWCEATRASGGVLLNVS